MSVYHDKHNDTWRVEVAGTYVTSFPADMRELADQCNAEAMTATDLEVEAVMLRGKYGALKAGLDPVVNGKVKLPAGGKVPGRKPSMRKAAKPAKLVSRSSDVPPALSISPIQDAVAEAVIAQGKYEIASREEAAARSAWTAARDKCEAARLHAQKAWGKLGEHMDKRLARVTLASEEE